MSIFENIEHRKSVRAYKPTPIESEKLQKVLEAGVLAPSAKNHQEWKFVAVTDPALQSQMSACCFNQSFISQAPATIVVCTGKDYVMRCGIGARTVDASIAMSFMILAADELELSTCWIGSFEEDKIRSLLNIPADYKIIALTPIGYAAEEGRPRSRKPFDEVVVYNKF